MASELSPAFADENRSSWIYIPSGIFMVLCPLLVGLRISVRLYRTGTPGADDWVAVVALIFTVLTSVMLMTSCHYGFGRHMTTLSPTDKLNALKFFYLCQVTYKMSINLTKCCILLLYLRVFHIRRWFRYACRAMVTIVGCYCVASEAATVFQCIPIRASFDKSIKDAVCISNARFWYANAGFSIATDVIIFLLPMQLVYQLEMHRAQKLALVGVFALGLFGVLTSCFRLTTLNLQATTPDPTYDIASALWTIIEPNVALMCACLPILRPVMSRALAGFGLSVWSSSGKCQSGKPGNESNSKNTRSAHGGSAGSDWMEVGDGTDATSHIRMGTLERGIWSAASEESILRNESEPGIRKTVEYSVTSQLN